MAITVQQVHPVAHLPLVLGVLRRLGVATTIDRLLPPHSGRVLSTGRGVEALLLAILDGHHALYKVGVRLAERGLLPLLQRDLQRASLNQVFGAVALQALAVYAIPTPWLHQDTTTIALWGSHRWPDRYWWRNRVVAHRKSPAGGIGKA